MISLSCIYLFHQNFKYFVFLYIQRKLREVSTKYQLFQKPANFEQRMLDCKRVLDSVKAELHVLEMKDIEPEVIQSHYDKCMVISRYDWTSLHFTGLYIPPPMGYKSLRVFASVS